ncbi:MAG: hypothetical protein RL722_442, partial [Pseudomonadota bacterium]
MKPSEHILSIQPSPNDSSPRPGLDAAAEMRETRSELVNAPHIHLSHLRRLDEQLGQQLDSLAQLGRTVLQRRLGDLNRPGDYFTHAVLCLELRDSARFEELLGLAEHQLPVEQAIASAMGWVGGQTVQGRLRELLVHPAPIAKRLALAACTMHRVDPGALLVPCLQSTDPGLRAMAARTAAAAGRADVMDMLLEGLSAPVIQAADLPSALAVPGDDEEASDFPSTEVIGFEDDDDQYAASPISPTTGLRGSAPSRPGGLDAPDSRSGWYDSRQGPDSRHGPDTLSPPIPWPTLPRPGRQVAPAELLRADVRGWSAWAAVMLGDRGAALATLREAALGDTPFATQAMTLFLKACELSDAHDVLRILTRKGGASSRRRLILGCGVVGDPLYLPWLTDMMSEDAWARVAGEAFSMITGADLAALDLVRHRQDGLSTRPSQTSDYLV